MAWQCRVTPKIFRVPPNISGMGKATNIKFGTRIHRNSLNKSPYYFFSEKGAWLCQVTSNFFRVAPNISGSDKDTNVKFGRPIQRVSLSKRALLFVSKKGAWPCHVTPNILGYPLIFQEWVNLWMWNLLIKEEMLNMRSLINKTANIKYKILSVYKTV